MSDKNVKLAYGNYVVEINSNGQNSNVESVQNSKELKYYKDNPDKVKCIQYKSKFNEFTDLEYSAGDNGLKENIILSKYNGKNIFQFRIKLTGLVPEKQEDGKILLYDKVTHNLTGGIPQAYMYDSAEEENLSDKVDMNITSIEGSLDEYVLTIKADEDFLKNQSTVYPVTIDPTVVVNSSSNTYDSFVQSAYSNSNYYLSTDLRVGWDETTGKVRSFIKFDLPSISGGMITDARFYAYENTGNTSSAYVELHRVTGNWSSSSITWNNQPGFSSSYESGTQQIVNGSKYYNWNITKLVSDWYKGSQANYGFVIKDRDENARYRRFNSSDNSSNHPYLQITYSPMPAIPTAASYGNSSNSKSGYVNLSWPAISGAAGYKIGIFNGKDYEYFDVGKVTSWTTQNKKIWPTPAETSAGRYGLHHDSLGTEFADDPVQVYINSAGTHQSDHNYWIKLSSYNSYGQESTPSYGARPTLPDRTAPANVSSVSISGTNGTINSGDTASITASWNGVTDYPSSIASNVKYYEVQKILNNGTAVAAGTVTHTGTGTYNITLTNQPDNTNYKIQVRAVDNNGNYSSYKVSSQWTSLDRTAPTGPTGLSLDAIWINSHLVLTWTGASDVGSGISSIQYKIDGGIWMSTGSAAGSGSVTINTSSLLNGQHTICARAIDVQGNYTISPSSVIFNVDPVIPTAAITSPTLNSYVKGTINITGTATDSNFKSYLVEISPAGGTETWTTIGSTHYLPVSNGTLETLNTTALADGAYKIRLTVKDNNNTSTALVGNIVIDNNIDENKISITSPKDGSLIDGKIIIKGTADDTNFQNAVLEYGQGLQPASWNLIQNISSPLSEEGTLGTWDVSSLSAGDYTIRLTVNDKAGNSASKTVTVNIPERVIPIGLGNDILNPTESISIGQVNIASGNLIIDSTDLSIAAGKGQGINISRTYNNQNKTLGLLGWGWSISIPKLIENADSSIDIIEEDGAKLHFTYDSDNSVYIPPTGHYEELTKNTENNTYQLKYKDGLKKIFDNVNNKVYVIDNNENALTYTMTADSIIITDAASRTVTLNIDSENNRIISMTDSNIDTAVRNWSYTYDNNNDLIQVTGPENVKVKYEYDNKHNLTAIITPNEIASLEAKSDYIINKILIQYDDNNKIIKTTDRKGLITSINYDAVNRKTGIVYCEGTDDSTAKEYYYDDLNRVTKEEDIKPSDNSVIKTTAYEYGDENNKALVTKIITAQGTSDEETEQYTYDSNGNTLTSTDTSNKTTTYTYENNYIKTTTDPDGTVKTNVYDSNYNLTSDGENTYTYSGGLLTEQRDNDGNITTYTYDDQGNNIGITSSDGQTTSKTYDNLGRELSETSQDKITAYKYNLRDQKTKVTETVDETDKITEYGYDAENNVIKEVTPDNIQNIYTYDCYGNVIETKVQNSSGSMFIKGTSEYYGDTDQLKKYTDSDGNVTSYQYDEAGTAKSITDACGNTINYDYDKQDRLTLTSASVTGTNGTQEISNSYTYENDKIKTITHNGFTYSFGYDDNGNNTTVNVGSQNLVANTYTSDNKVQDTTYGNNQKIGYVYDAADKVTGKKYNDELKFEYSYNEDSKISVLNDHINGVDYNYSYDETGRLNKIVDSNNNYIQYGYRDTDIVSSVVSYINGVTKETDYTYNEADKPESMTWGESSLNYNYDEIGRLSNSIINTGSTSYATNYSYKPGSNGATTEKVESISNNGNDISYTYYDNGNIKTITSGGKVISYKYDEIGELTREDNQVLDKTIIYSYDAGGNITEKTEYPYTTGTPENSLKTYSYGYNDSNWKDKLTSFDGKEITYDEIGNPLTYDGYTYTWEAGRQLAGISGNGKNITYKYNESGIRTEKTVDGVTTKYYLGRDKVIYEDNGTDKIYYTYDLSDRLISMNLNGVEYYYVRNGQGDIIGLIDGNGIQIVSYTYNTWGKLISIKDQSGNDITNDTSSVGYKNPYRYRGYRYDTETGLYYLQSRYYNPDMGRFINADDTNVLQTIQGQLLGTNLFAYGNNNPVTNIDPTGYWVLSVGIEGQAAFVIGIYIGVAVSIDGNWNVAISYSIGFAIITNAAASLSAYVAYYRNKKSVSNLSGWGVSVGAAFSVCAHISGSGSLDAGFKGGLGGVVSASYGWGVSLAPIPYYQTRVGYTGIMYKFNLKTLLRYWYNGSSKRIFRFLGLTATITKQSTYVDVYFKFLRKRIRLYNTAKIKIY